MKNVGKPCDREGHARIDGRELETERNIGHGHGEEQHHGKPGGSTGSAPYRRSPPPRQLSTLHERSVRLYREIAEIDRGHHHEALYWADREQEKVNEITEQIHARKSQEPTDDTEKGG
ncbi:MAG: AMED_5909 family protein [Acidimicrobiia bacterium]